MILPKEAPFGSMATTVWTAGMWVEAESDHMRYLPKGSEPSRRMSVRDCARKAPWYPAITQAHTPNSASRAIQLKATIGRQSPSNNLRLLVIQTMPPEVNAVKDQASANEQPFKPSGLAPRGETDADLAPGAAQQYRQGRRYTPIIARVKAIAQFKSRPCR